MRYRDAGVDIARADRLKQAIGGAVSQTWSAAVRRLPGGFCGMIEWPGRAGGAPALLAATMDGVGTKLHLALEADRVGDAAADLVYHCADDLLAHGGRPLAFLDYIAQARLDAAVVLAAVEGLARACREVGAALLGGETAEMPDTYVDGVVDIAGCMLGCAAGDRILDGSQVRPGDLLFGVASNGLHTNGYSLARKVLAHSGLALGDRLPGGAGESVGDALLASHRWYGPAVLPLLERGAVHAIAHITGGGIAGNLVRVLPEGCGARVNPAAWQRPPVFRWLIETGRIPEDDARGAFNLGIGLILVGSAGHERAIAEALEGAGESAMRIGEIVLAERGVEWVES